LSLPYFLYDHSFSCGVEGDMEVTEVPEGFQAVSEACKKHKVPMIVGADKDSVEQRLKDGYRILISGSDLHAPGSLREVYERMREVRKQSGALCTVPAWTILPTTLAISRAI